MNQIWNSHKRAWLIGIGLLIIALSVTATSVFAVTRYSPVFAVTRHSPPSEQNGVYFHTLPPGTKLPSSAECARLIRGSFSHESRPVNAQFNRTTGESVSPGFFPAGDSPQAAELTPLIAGDFTGTTQEILEWAACKWGIDQNIVFAQAAVESWWHQTKLGDWTTNVKLCPPGHGLGADGTPGKCPQSYGILQNRYSSEESAWPGIAVSTAMNVDAAYAIWRSCYNGSEVWLNDGPKSQPYRTGDLWGCVGRWFTGNWHTPEADKYIGFVKKFVSERIWLQPYFSRTS